MRPWLHHLPHFYERINFVGPQLGTMLFNISKLWWPKPLFLPLQIFQSLLRLKQMCWDPPLGSCYYRTDIQLLITARFYVHVYKEHQLMSESWMQSPFLFGNGVIIYWATPSPSSLTTRASKILCPRSFRPRNNKLTYLNYWVMIIRSSIN